jgi:2-oxoglutarate dehydrogenase E1 component
MALKAFHALNLSQAIDLYERYRLDPSSVDFDTRTIFDSWKVNEDGNGPSVDIGEILQAAVLPGAPSRLPERVDLPRIVAAANLAQAIRTFGHLQVQLDPVGFFSPPGDVSLSMQTYGLTEGDLAGLPASLVGGPVAVNAVNALQAIELLRKIYMTTCGYDYSHIHNLQERNWLRTAAEEQKFRQPFTPEASRSLLERLTQVEVFELFLNRFFPGKTRFSIEGEDMLIPALDEIADLAAGAGICTLVIGMPHRGRLNVLTHILAVPYEQIFREFKDPAGDASMMHERGWTGDVKYHRGSSYASQENDEIRIVIDMPPIPSHLELVNPVVEGAARAFQSKVDQPGAPHLFPEASLPILIHGDASFSGEGIVAETLNLSRLAGYQVAGAIHIIVNNQLGYTTYPAQGRSTLYSSDPAKGFEIPVMHVNADDPQACLEAVRTAFAYREAFHKDFLIDLVGYRRHGHNEGDEPAFTQPLLYPRIEKHPTLRKLWASQLEDQAIIGKGQAEKMVQAEMQRLQNIMESLHVEEAGLSQKVEPASPLVKAPDTTVDQERLLGLADDLLRVPAGFNLNSKLARAMNKRRGALAAPDQPLVDWSLAEQLALASILADGIPIRMTGQDVERGTFSQRHAVYHDTLGPRTHVPLQSLPQARASFEIRNSPLSEAAVLAFEYGYDLHSQRCLVIWESQYGDFVNNAQSILDEFILSGQAKWEQLSALVMLLPHGNEGQGPNHSSSRPERFLQVSAGIDLRLVNCTTAAQYFHLLRDQALRLETNRLPLVVLAPKSLLRHPRVASSISDLSTGKWLPVLEDDLAGADPSSIRRLILCSGKIAVDLMTSELRKQALQTAIIRLEQLSPFPRRELKNVLERYDRMEELVWVQEEPENMGAWNYLRPRLLELTQAGPGLKFMARPASPSSSEGSLTRYMLNQADLIRRAFEQGNKSTKKVSKPSQRARSRKGQQ